MRKLRVLLWSPFGCGEHYNGPASFSHRLYSTDPDRFEVTLVHGFASQEETPILQESVFLRRFEGGARGLYRWDRDAHRWLDTNAQRFDVLHGLTGFHMTMVPAHYAQTRHGLPAAVFIANANADLQSKGGLKGLLRLAQKRQRMAREVSAVIGMSREIREELRAYGIDEERISDIPMGVDLERFSGEQTVNGRAAFGLGGARVIAFSGEVCSRKRPHLLVEALGLAQSQGLDWRVMLAGPEADEEYCQEIRSRAEVLGVSDRVHWIGFTRQIEKVYAAADVYCLPSSNEGMPASVVEALGSGLPSIITEFSSAHDLVPSTKEGAIVDASPDAVFEGLRSFLEDSTRLAAGRVAARVHALNNFSAAAVLDRYEALFESISSRSRN